MSAGREPCPYCGRPIPSVSFEFAGVERTRPGSCPCAGAKMAAAAEKRERERDERLAARKMFESRMRKAGVPPRFFDAAAPRWSPETESCWVYGPNGTGKSAAAAALVVAAVKAGRKARFSSLREISGRINDARAEGEPSRAVLMSYADCSLLVLDDLGKENFTAAQVRVLFEVVDYRWSHCLPTVVTSNFSSSVIVSRLMAVDASTARAVASRLSGWARVEMAGGDRRILDDSSEALGRRRA